MTIQSKPPLTFGNRTRRITDKERRLTTVRGIGTSEKDWKMSAVVDLERAVNERYGRAAHNREAELCCPVEYDPKLLAVIPDEIKERDYGCGDPSAFVHEGDVVLDLASYTPTLSIIIPALNEARCIGATLDAISQLSGRVEMIVVDGGSDDHTREISSGRGAKVI